MSNDQPAILWFRQDLRIKDNPALQAAAKYPIVAVYIFDDEDPWKPGGASCWWLYESLKSLKESLKNKGVQLIFKRGRPLEILNQLVETVRPQALYWNRCYEPYAVKRDQVIKTYLKDKGVHCESFKGGLLAEPWELETKNGCAYKVFSPFWKTLQQFVKPNIFSTPMLQGWKGTLKSDQLDDWKLSPTLWGSGLRKKWCPGEIGAWTTLKNFLDNSFENYAEKRDYPSENATSALSPHLHWGEISPAQLWNDITLSYGAEAFPFLRQLAWREFSYHLLYYFPNIPIHPIKSIFADFPWESNPDFLKAWQNGQTGYPLIDAGMRELWHTGWMHNRVRMVVASFLVKDLLIPWQKGEEWFWDTLVDADLANNSVSWQWVAGCGVDPAPYFRVFNPVLQSQKFDSTGTYIKKWVPELRNLEPPFLHSPWTAPASCLTNAEIRLGVDYPLPIVEHDFARKRALSIFHKLV